MLFKELVDVYESLKATPSRLEKTALIADFIGKVPADDLPIIVTFLTGRIFPEWEQRKTGIASQSMIKIISATTHNSEAAVVDSYKHSGQLGLTAEEMFGKRQAADVLRAGGHHGQGAVRGLLGARPHDRRRVGDEETEDADRHPESRDVTAGGEVHRQPGHRERALGRQGRRHGRRDRPAFGVDAELVRRAHMLTSDLGETAKIARLQGTEGLAAITIQPMRPVRPMLAQNVASIREALDEMGGKAEFEFKYDGARLQIHKKGNEVRLYSRRLEDLTDALPEIVDFVRQSVTSDTAILDSECIAIDKATGRPIPFQNILTRLRRIYKVEETRQLFPLILRPFDVLFKDGQEHAGAAAAGAPADAGDDDRPAQRRMQARRRADHGRRGEGAGDVRRVHLKRATRGSWART